VSTVVISPHLDDAVLGIGALLSAVPQAVVVTAFAGDPGPATRASAWDQSTSHLASHVLAIRRREDVAALQQLGADAVHLRFLEAPYRSRQRWHEQALEAELFTALRQQIGALVEAHEPAAMFVPLGLGHVDHVLTSCAAISAWLVCRPCALLAYAEQPYAMCDRGLARARFHDLRATPLPFERVAKRRHRAAKAKAISEYKSQIPLLRRAFDGWDGETIQEQVWRLRFDEALGRLPGPWS
jgi:LmbE family N-acetylglucosaminyl deacetylase